MNHSLSPFQKLFNFLDEPYGKGKSMSRFFQGNEAKGIVYDAMPFTSHLIENVDIVMKFFTQGNFCKLNGSLVLSFSRGRSETVGKHQSPCRLQDCVIRHAEGLVAVYGQHRFCRFDVSFGQR
jgi:hypothetical protein